MMNGNVFNRQILMMIAFCLPGQPDLLLEFVLDTGFTGYLTLPPAVVAALNLPFLHRMPANLADDSMVDIPVHVAIIRWNGVQTTVRVLATGRRPLLGTALLDDKELVAQFRDGGLATVDDL